VNKFASWLIPLAALVAGCETSLQNSAPVERVHLDQAVAIAPPPPAPEALARPSRVLAGGGPIGLGPVDPVQPSPITPVPADKWPHVPYAEIKAYLYNLEGSEGTAIVNEKGRLDRSVCNRSGVFLGQRQTEQLFEALYQPGVPYGVAHCYRPRHAFVFYDAAHRPVAQFEVCFGCNQYASWPRGLPEPINLTALSQLVQDLGLPIFADEKGYDSLKRQSKSGWRFVK
jgi:hypothetical protein